jgi:hypothetical protein
MRLVIAIVSTSLVYAAALPASSQETRQLGPHVHGASHLTIAVDGKSLQMELHAPGSDIVGFEYAATTPQQRAAVTAATTTLSDPIALFGIPAGAACAVGKVQVSIVEEGEDEAAAAAPAAGAVTAKPATPLPAPAKHSEFQVSYQLTCANLSAISGLNVTYFSKFKNATDLDIDLVTARGAFSLEATKTKPSVSTKNMF